MLENGINKHVAIIGGGMAGLAAATKLSQAGIKVTLFEASHQLGGRARGVDYKGVKLDNGQHILLGAYRATLGLLKLAGLDESKAFKRIPLSLTMIDVENNTTFSLQSCNALPAPLHILVGLLFAKGLSLNLRFSAIKLMAWMKLNQFKLKQDEPLAQFLQGKNQTETLIKNLWEPLCLAALNTPLNTASTQIFLNVLRDSFAKQKSDSDMLLPRIDLSSLLADALADYIQQHGGEIRTNSTIKKIEQTDTGFTLASNDQQEHFSHVIIACAPHQLRHICIDAGCETSFNYQPITTVYLQYAKECTLPQAMTGLVGTLSQWVFDRGQLCNQHGLMAVVISAHPTFTITQNQLAETVNKELKNAFPQLETPLWHKVITEKRATFSCDAGLLRPNTVTQIDNLYLVGDYTSTGNIENDYPATIEGAVRSGLVCADLIYKHFD